MKIVSKEKVVVTIDELLSTLDLLETQVKLRVNHVLKHTEDHVLNEVEITEAYVAHLEEKMSRHVENENWLKGSFSLKSLAV